MNTLLSFRAGARWLIGMWLAGGTALAAPAFENHLEKTFQVSPGGKLVLDADQGSCEITSVEGGNALIRVLREVKDGTKARADELFADHEVTFKQDGAVVSVLAKNKRN